MEWNQTVSGGNTPEYLDSTRQKQTDAGRVSPVILRLLPYVHHPPATVLVPGWSADALALDARGYKVAVIDLPATQGDRGEVNAFPLTRGDFLRSDFLKSDFKGSFDLLCEHGLFSALPPSRRGEYVAAAARSLRSGGRLFGAFLDFNNGAVGQEGPPFGTNAAELLTRFSSDFDVERLVPSAFTTPSGLPQLEAIFVRR